MLIFFKVSLEKYLQREKYFLNSELYIDVMFLLGTVVPFAALWVACWAP